jgi:hypothetical protein
VVGAALGGLEGSPVGAGEIVGGEEGFAEGAALGTSDFVGEEDGCNEGIELGAKLGISDSVGVPVGYTEGETVGSSEGGGLGIEEGKNVVEGSCEGIIESRCVGIRDFVGLGVSAGLSVGKRVDDSLVLGESVTWAGITRVVSISCSTSLSPLFADRFMQSSNALFSPATTDSICRSSSFGMAVCSTVLENCRVTPACTA